MNSSFFAFINRARHIRRWGLMRNTEPENLQEHAAQTAILAHALAVIGREIYGADVDPGRVCAAALYHDAPEILTGDMPAPVKYYNPAILDSYKQVEAVSRDTLYELLPAKLRPAYRETLYCEEDNPALYRYIKAADKLSAYIKCVEEMKTGNAEFRPAAEQLRQAVDGMKMPEVDYFIEHFLGSFGLSLDELR